MAFWWRRQSGNRSNSELNHNRGKLGTSRRIDCGFEGNLVRRPPMTMVTQFHDIETILVCYIDERDI